ncbi:hypothetical protein ACTFIW_009900 [Dictyostelium discoideum]
MNTIRIAIWNVQGSSTITSASLTKTVLDKFDPDIALLTETNIKQPKINNINKIFNNNTTHAPALKAGQGVSIIIKNKEIISTSNIINERVIISEWTISNFTFKCATIYAPAKEHLRMNWFKENLTTELLSCDLITGDFNVNALDIRNQTNTFITRTLKEAGLRELLPHSGVTFPRNNSIIDRIFLSKKLMHLQPASTIKKTKIKSDHNLLMLTLKIPNYYKEVKPKNRLWRQNLEVLKIHRTAKFINKQIKYFEIKSKETQSKHYKTDICHRWLTIKEEIKKSSIQLELQHANNQRTKKLNLINKLEESTNKLEKDQLKDQLDKLLKEEHREKLANQTNVFINFNETPSRFLTSKLRTKNRNNLINQIIDQNTNQLVTNQEEILETTRQYYEKLYQCKPCDEEAHNFLLRNNIKQIDPEIIKKLALKIEEYELDLCIEKLQEGKAPGIDGLIPTFYKNHKEIISPLLLELFNYFLNNGIPSQFKQGVLITIYKNKGDPNHLDNYRPITLLNVDYKIYSKILNNRILRFLNNVISPFQTGFVPRRILHDNIITLNSVIDIAHREMQSNTHIAPIITFYDFEKAFDSISHKAIVRTLAHLKLPTKFIKAITNLLINSETAIYMNNNMSSKFISKRGTKQGDPISPTIFALVVECMATSIISDKNIRGIGLENTKILQFADDTSTIAFCWIDHHLMDLTIKRFCSATSAAINKNKCVCITLKPGTNTIYKKATSDERYLGFNFNNKGIEPKIPEIATKIKSQLINWSKHSSTYQGRIILAKTYALSQLTFHNYLSNIDAHCQIENTVTKYIFNTKSKNTMSSSRRLTLPHYDSLPELKTIYNDLMKIQHPKFDSFNPTPGQIEIMKKINRTTLPFLEIRKIINLKGRDLLWRIALKALPKIFNKPCIWCDETETSEHIFFKCKSHLKDSQKCIDFIQDKCGGSKITWGIEVLNKLDIALTANSIAIICENIWRKRNKKIHEDITLKNLRKEILVHELKKTQSAAWEKTKNNIYKLIRQENKATNKEHSKKFQNIISKQLERFSKNWNSPLHTVTLPTNLNKYITSLNTLFTT